MADLSTDIETAAKAPKAVNVDGINVQAPDVGDQIEADRYLKSNAAAKRKDRGLHITKLKPPGSI